MLPMIKANAYGHGAAWAAKTLVDLPQLYGLGVATLEEGQEIREALGARHRRTCIFVFSGCTPWTDEKGPPPRRPWRRGGGRTSRRCAG